MDTSLEYIKQCEKAEEIQGRVLERGDYYTFPLESIRFNAKESERIGNYWQPLLWYDIVPISFGHFAIWLPRQDQLWILSGLTWQEFDKECLKYDVDTKEQAGIQVVMSQFDKKWTNGDWV